MNFTHKQRLAIDERGKTLLVSAAAGSGKTATLTRRIIESITDEKNPADISRMLIVTFTRAAAAELRERISASISERIADDPSNTRLARQALLLPSAHICTIDSFCNDILQTHASELGLSAAFRICDEAEGALIQRTVMEELIYALYEGELPSVCGASDFSRFAMNITSVGAEQSLSDKLLDIYNRAQETESGISVFEMNADSLKLNDDILRTSWGYTIYSDTYDFLSHYIDAYETSLSDLNLFDLKTYEKYAPPLTAIVEHMRKCLDSLDSWKYDNVRGLITSFPTVKLPPIREKDKTEFSIIAATVHKEFKKKLTDVGEYYSYASDEMKELLEKMESFSSTLFCVLSEYKKRIESEMRKRNIMTFSDVERYAYKLLCDENEEPTPLARLISLDYDYIYVDEYQDVNYIQHKIFECISQPRNRFMVGDIKQSIYSFRGAEPDIFADLKSRYPIYDSQEDVGDNATIFMSENFRCDKSVIDFSNAVFDVVFGCAGDSIDYRDDDRLVFAKGNAGTESHGKVQVHLFDSKTVIPKDANPDEVVIMSNEADFVASEIEKLISCGQKNSGEPIRPSDIAVILRSAKGQGERFLDAIRRRGIPVNYEKRDNFFLSPDVLLVLAILNAIDNPKRDTYLAGAMRSPVFGFTLTDLISVRRWAPDAPSLYDALLSYNEDHPQFEKGRYFVGTITKFRAISGGIPSDKLISRLYSQTDLLTVADNRSDLLLLYDYAKKFEASSFKGLYNFINYINEIIREKKRVSLGSVNSQDGVQLITAHHSKGLEFPICFICGCGSKYADFEVREDLVFERGLGACVRFADEGTMTIADNPLHKATVSTIRRKQAEEEMRTLYVELTRARERLYVTATPRSSPDRLVEYASLTSDITDEYTLLHMRDPITLIVSALAQDGSAAELKIHSFKDVLRSDESSHIEITESSDTILSNNENDGRNASDITPVDDKTATEMKGEEKDEGETKEQDEYGYAIEKIKQNLQFEYPYSYLNRVPGKLSVSKLYPSVLDGTEETDDDTANRIIIGTTDDASDDTGEDTNVVDFTPKHRIPSFISGEIKDKGAKMGSATHLFLQFCNFENAKKMGVAAELRRLVDREFIDEKSASLVRIRELERFFDGELYRQIKDSDKIYRELRFNTNLDASDFTDDIELKEKLSGTPLLIQGVIDLIVFDRDGEYALIDYKTDRVSFDNRKESRETLRRRHEKQLFYYSLVCEKMFGKKPKKRMIYSLALGELIDV